MKRLIPYTHGAQELARDASVFIIPTNSWLFTITKDLQVNLCHEVALLPIHTPYIHYPKTCPNDHNFTRLSQTDLLSYHFIMGEIYPWINLYTQCAPRRNLRTPTVSEHDQI